MGVPVAGMIEVLHFVADVLRTLVPCLLIAAAYPLVGRFVRPAWRPRAMGVLFGLGAVAAMLTPLEPHPGVMLDLRAVPIALAGPFGGPLAAVLAAIPAGAYRLAIGGSSVIGGLLAVLVPLGLGVAIALWPLDRGPGAPWVRTPGGRFGARSPVVLALVMGTLFLAIAAALPSLDEVALEPRLAAATAVVLGVLALGPALMAADQRERLQAALSTALQRQAETVESLPGLVYRYRVPSPGVLLVDYMSPQAKELLGVPAEVVMQDVRAFFAAVHPDDRAHVAASLLRPLAPGSEPELSMHDARVRLPDGRTRHIRARGLRRLMPDGSIISSGVAVDITELMATRAELHQARHQAESASRAKSAFLSVMSHEMRTPLNAILGFADVLLATPLDEAQRDAVEHQQQAGRALLALVDDVLQFSRLEAEQELPERQPADLRVLLAHAAGRFGGGADERGVTLRVDVSDLMPELVRLDAARVLRVLQRMVDNAVKFSPRGGQVVLGAQPLPLGWVRFSVADAGPGVPAPMQAAIFEPFTQMDEGTNRRHGGPGLGLAICRRLVAGMGGELGVENRAEGGALFWFSIPCG